MQNKRIISIVAILVVLVIIIGAGVYFYKNSHKPVAVEGVKIVGMAKVTLGDNTSNYELPGEFAPKYEASMGFQVNGHIVARNVSIGDTVKAGTVMYSMESADYALKLQTAEAQVATAQSELELQTINLRRSAELLAGAAIPQSQYDQQYTTTQNSKDALRGAHSNRDEVKRQVGYTELIAPADCIVERVLADVGDVVNVGTPVVKVGYLKEWDAQVYLPEKDRVKFPVGTRVKVTSFVKGVPAVSGTIREIAGSADSRSRAFQTKVTLDNRPDNVQLGMTCSVNLMESQRQAVYISLEALVQDNANRPYVWVVENGVAHKREVVLGKYGVNNNIEILSGLNAGDTIIVAGVITVLDGEKVQPWQDQNRSLGW